MKRTITSGLILASLTISSVSYAQNSKDTNDITPIITELLLSESSMTQVTNGNDSGPGSLRQALSDGATNIIINGDITTITINNTLEYNSTSTVQITGLGTNQTVNGSELDGDSDILSINQGATLNISNLNFIGSFDEVNDDPNNPSIGTAIFVDVPNSQTDTVELNLENVSISNIGGHGIHVSDCTVRDGCEEGEGSPASVTVNVTNLMMNRVGIGRQDGDGIRVDEREEGSITFIAQDSSFTNVGADGVELDEGDNGDITANIDSSVFDSNGEFCAFADEIEDTPCDNDGDPDLDDGFDIDEAGSGSIIVTITNSDFSNNFDEGLDFDEEDGGQIIMSVSDSIFRNNEDQGIRASEDDNGDVEASFINITVGQNNQDDEAIRIEEENGGDLVVEIFDSTVSDSDTDDEGLRIEESGSGSGTLEIRNSNFTEFNLDNIELIQPLE